MDPKPYKGYYPRRVNLLKPQFSEGVRVEEKRVFGWRETGLGKGCGSVQKEGNGRFRPAAEEEIGLSAHTQDRVRNGLSVGLRPSVQPKGRELPSLLGQSQLLARALGVSRCRRNRRNGRRAPKGFRRAEERR